MTQPYGTIPIDFKTFVDFCSTAEQVLRFLSKGGTRISIQGKSPIGLRAGAVYLLVTKKGLPISQREIAIVFGVTEPTVRSLSRLVEDLIESTDENWKEITMSILR